MKPICGFLPAFLILAMVTALFAARPAQAQTLTTLHTFRGSPDGSSPMDGLVRDAKGALYGTTRNGGSNGCKPFLGCGTIFKMDTNGKETILYTFKRVADGLGPNANLVFDAEGNLYGTTTYGGMGTICDPGGGCGVVFKLDTQGKETVLHSFIGGEDGAYPEAGVIRDSNGNLYGVTGAAGAAGVGVVFEITGVGKETVLYTFSGGRDGANPQAGLIRDAAGNLYGTTVYGGNLGCGDTYGCGVAFKLDTAGHETVLYTFCSATKTACIDGSEPEANLIRDAEGNLYGTTSFGGNSCSEYGAGCGVVFRVDTSGNETVLHSFTGGADGGLPVGGLIGDGAGNIYGSTSRGGDDNCNAPGGCGVVFKITP